MLKRSAMTKRLQLCTLLVFIATTVVVSAQPFVQEVTVRDRYLELTLDNRGIFGYTSVGKAPGLSYINGRDTIRYLKGGGLWFATRRERGDSIDTMTFVTFDHLRGTGWAAPGGWMREAPRPEDSALNGIYESWGYDRFTGEWYDLLGPHRLPWPLWSREGGFIAPRRPGRFVADTALRNPDSSGSPAFAIPSQYFARYHDGVTALYGAEGSAADPIGLEIEQNIYTGFDLGQDAARNLVIAHYRVINVSGDTLRDSYLSAMLDPSVGEVADNDRAAYMADRGIAYAWSDPEGAAAGAGTLALLLLEGPYVDFDSRSPNFRFIADRYRVYNDTMVHGELGVHGFRNWSDSKQDPTGSTQRYDLIAAEGYTADSAAGDQRMLLSVGPFNMRPFDTAIFAIGIGLFPLQHAPWVTGYDLRRDASELYNIGYFLSVDEAVSSHSSIRIFPNPAADRATVEIALQTASPLTLRLTNLLGESIRSHHQNMATAGPHSLSLDLEGICSGVYLLSIETDSGRSVEKLIVR